MTINLSKTILEEIIKLLEARKVVKPNGCWELDLLPNSQGYSIIYYGTGREDARLFRANRISAAHFLGLDYNDKTQLALHKIECSNKRCWNPDHLYVGTESQNRSDAYKTGMREKLVNCKICGNEIEKGYRGRCKNCWKKYFREYNKGRTA